MNRKKLLALFGLKWNPFTPDLPTDGLLVTPRLESFVQRVETMVHDGGFALILGEPGNGKSVTMRLIEQHLAEVPDIVVGVLTRTQSGLADFYRELGQIFGVELRPHNRWNAFDSLRKRWRAHAQASLVKPVLLIDEAQEMPTEVLEEIRHLARGHLDTQAFLNVVFAGLLGLAERFRQPTLVSLGTRIRTRLILDHATPEELTAVLRHAIKKAGAPQLLPETLQNTLVGHAAGNYRVLMNMGAELLAAAAQRNQSTIDEKLFFEVFTHTPPRRKARKDEE